MSDSEMARPLKRPETVAEMVEFAAILQRLAKAVLGPRSSAIILVGMPLDDDHDRFAAGSYGPCLTARGLLAWGSRQIENRIDEGDTSINGKPHRQVGDGE